MKLTIDLSAIAHSIRRWWWNTLTVPWRFGDRDFPGRCVDCGSTLTADETTYYGRTCNRCEGAALAELQRLNKQELRAFEALDAARPPAPCPSFGPCTFPDCGHFRNLLDVVGLAPPKPPKLGPPWCCKKGEAANTAMCPDCAEACAGYQAAMAGGSRQ